MRILAFRKITVGLIPYGILFIMEDNDMQFIMDNKDMEFIEETEDRIRRGENVNLLGVEGDKIYLELKITNTAKANAFLFNIFSINTKKIESISEDLGVIIERINYRTGDLQKEKIMGILERTLEDLRRS